MGDTGEKKSGKLYGNHDLSKTGPKANGDGPIGHKAGGSFVTGTSLSKEDGSIGAKKPKAGMTSGTKGNAKGEDYAGKASGKS